VRRAVKSSPKKLATGTILLIIGAIILATAAVALAIGLPRLRQTPAAITSVPNDLTACGSIPCPSKGADNAPVTIIEISDYRCSHCREYTINTEPKIEEQYIMTGKVRYIVHSFNLWPETQRIAAAALCANDQGKFFEYHMLLFQNQGHFDSTSLTRYAQQVGMDVQAFATCVNSDRHTADVIASSSAARVAGVNSTPSFFINGKLIVGTLPFQCKPGTPECAAGSFQALIETALRGSQ